MEQPVWMLSRCQPADPAAGSRGSDPFPSGVSAWLKGMLDLSQGGLCGWWSGCYLCECEPGCQTKQKDRSVHGGQFSAAAVLTDSDMLTCPGRVKTVLLKAQSAGQNGTKEQGQPALSSLSQAVS